MKDGAIDADVTDTKTESGRKTSGDVPTGSAASFHSNFSIGGPMSAFSTIGPSDVSRSIFKPYTLCESEFPAMRYDDPLLQTTLYNSRRDLMPDMPIAPAFAQIFQRRRRLESRPRRQRTTFTSDQTLKLELEYNRADYITRPRRFELAELLSLTESQIKIWFQNRRAKDKRIEKAHMDHQLRAMGYNSMASPGPLSLAYKNMCGPCMMPPISMPGDPLLYGNKLTEAPLPLL